jgi:hypothetical protein
MLVPVAMMAPSSATLTAPVGSPLTSMPSPEMSAVAWAAAFVQLTCAYASLEKKKEHYYAGQQGYCRCFSETQIRSMIQITNIIVRPSIDFSGFNRLFDATKPYAGIQDGRDHNKRGIGRVS